MKKVLFVVAVAIAAASFASCSNNGDTCMCRTKVLGVKSDWEDWSEFAKTKEECNAQGGGVFGAGMECEMR
jgi:hypothetical protein